ncbi:MAG: methyltransferase [Novosphingobium sp.]
MRSLSPVLLGACLAVASTSAFARDFAPPSVTAALADPRRDDEARNLDESRKPAEILAFLGLEPGMQAADIMTGQGYWAQIMSDMLGAKGKVTALDPSEFHMGPQSEELWARLPEKWPAITWSSYPFTSFSPAPDSFDFSIINLSYHDLYWESEKYHLSRIEPADFVKALYAATRPGGIVGVIDHVGLPGDTRATVDKLHRIDPEVVKRDFLAAGFTLEASSDMLANPEDDHTKLVFDPAIRFKTDRFVFRFRKPAA